jgi:uncharacterized protein YoxC
MNNDQQTRLEKIKEMLQNKMLQSLDESIRQLSSDISKANFVRQMDFEKVVIDKVIAELPERMKINWEEMPLQKEVDLTPLIEAQEKTTQAISEIKIKTDLNPLQKAVKAFETSILAIGKSAIQLLNRIVFSLSEPDQLIFDGDRTTEVYGDRTVTYVTTRNSAGRMQKVIRKEG